MDVVYFPDNIEYDAITGLDALANAKRGGSQLDAGFKVPKERITSVAASAEEEDKSEISTIDESEHGVPTSASKHANRRYREMTSETSQAGILLILNLYICC